MKSYDTGTVLTCEQKLYAVMNGQLLLTIIQFVLILLSAG